jgi:dTMP kinase
VNGLFLTFEGIDGCGKTTLATRVARRLRESGRRVVETREPGGTDIGRRIRTLVLERSEESVEDVTEVFLFAADRAQHVAQLIRPALESGVDVVCDRFSDSSVAYQGFGRGGDVDALIGLQKLATQGLEPDLTVLVDLDTEAAQERGGPASDRIEDGGPAFYTRVREGFLNLSRRFPERFLVVDGTRSEVALEGEVYEEVCRRLEKS